MSREEQRNLLLQLEASQNAATATPIWKRLSSSPDLEPIILSIALTSIHRFPIRREIPGEPF